MDRRLLAPCLGLVCFLALSAAQEPGAPTPAPAPVRPTQTAGEKKISDSMIARMQGLWQMSELRTPKMPTERRLETGYVLVSGMCFSIEVHFGYLAPDGRNVVDRNFQTGMHRFELDSAGFMDTKTVIGTFTRMGSPEWERPQTARRYQVKLGEDEMIWSNTDGTTFVLKKQPDGPAVRRDIFGRPVREKPKDDEKAKEDEKPPK